jgi:hypothetical protein
MFIFSRFQVSICIGVNWNSVGESSTSAKPGGKPWYDLRYSPPLALENCALEVAPVLLLPAS